jgi:hypothetical protein
MQTTGQISAGKQKQVKSWLPVSDRPSHGAGRVPASAMKAAIMWRSVTWVAVSRDAASWFGLIDMSARCLVRFRQGIPEGAMAEFGLRGEAL